MAAVSGLKTARIGPGNGCESSFEGASTVVDLSKGKSNKKADHFEGALQQFDATMDCSSFQASRGCFKGQRKGRGPFPAPGLDTKAKDLA